MIQLSSNTILILYPDSSTEPLDTAEIRNRILRACISAGETNSWIAGELALAVEFSLLSSEQRMIRSEDLDRMILSSLEDAGFPAVAVEFKRIVRSAPPDFLPASEDSVLMIVQNNLAMEPDRMKRVVSRVLRSLDLLGMKLVSRGLILELSRQFRDTDLAIHMAPPAETVSPADGVAVLLRQEELEKMISGKTGTFLRSKVLQIPHISRLFSALRIDLSLTAFAELNGLMKPVTELAFWSISSELTLAVDEICRIADEICRKRGEEECTPLPLSLTVRDGKYFAGTYMNCPAEYASDCAGGLIGAFISSLSRQPFKVDIQ